jgi:hypothetical protein
MPVQLEWYRDRRTLEVTVTDRLQADDYQRLMPLVEECIAEQDKIRVLFVMRDFKGWNAGALWEDVKFDVKHFNDIDRLAMVGEKNWQEGMAVFCKPFTSADVRFFELSDLEEARRWLQQD